MLYAQMHFALLCLCCSMVMKCAWAKRTPRAYAGAIKIWQATQCTYTVTQSSLRWHPWHLWHLQACAAPAQSFPIQYHAP